MTEASAPKPAVQDADTTARLFRARVLKPAEGVFLFHPRALDRLVTAHLVPRGLATSVPHLDYFLMPCADFLRELETENPEALSVIEGLHLPEAVILLPLPPEEALDEAGFTQLLRDYWARRFEGEIARAWQRQRDTRDDAARHGPEGLRALLGEPAWAEIRDVMTQDGLIPADSEPWLLCRGFIALVARLRCFAPGTRGFFFPAVQDWHAFDRWLLDSGLDLKRPLAGEPLPRLLERTRPDPRCELPSHPPSLPAGLPYAHGDPDLSHAGSPPTLASQTASPPIPDAAPACPVPDREPRPVDNAARARALALALLRQSAQFSRRTWRTRLGYRTLDGLAFLAGFLAPLLESARRVLPRCAGHALDRLVLALRLLCFGQVTRAAYRAERANRFAAAVVAIATARRLAAHLGMPPPPVPDPIREELDVHATASEQSLAHQLAARWKLSPDQADDLIDLIARLGAAIAQPVPSRAAQAVLRDLQQVLNESTATYFRLRPFAWLLSAGRQRLRQILPFQADLNALRALDMALNHLERIDWTPEVIEESARPLEALIARLSARVRAQLEPHLRKALQSAGFQPNCHREEVAANKLLHELLDTIQRRRHLKFTDVRDSVARNILRLPDPTLGELFRGDRLAHFDRVAARALPGVYQPGELYIKGLQQLSAPLFGTPRGRLLLRHLILPLGIAYLAFKILDLILAFAAPGALGFEFASLAPVTGAALLINALVYTRIGRFSARVLWQSSRWLLRLILFDGLRRILRWTPLARILKSAVMRRLDRNLLQPLLIGGLTITPLIVLGVLIEGFELDAGVSWFFLAFALGTLIHNTPLGRRILDDAATATMRWLRRLNQTLVIGLVRELLAFFKEVNRRFQQALHHIEELLSHRLHESPPQLVLKALFAPLWKFCEAVIQFYVTVLIEPQINPIKHFPLVTVAHKLMLPFLPAITGLLLGLVDPVMPKWLAYPFVTLTILLLPGLAGFLVWELKENWKLYAANHLRLDAPQATHPARKVQRADLTRAPIEPAIVGRHGENMRGLLLRGFHSGTLPKAFDRLRRVLHREMREGIVDRKRLRDTQRHLAEVEHAIATFCDRELADALRLRGERGNCPLARIDRLPPRLSTHGVILGLRLHPRDQSIPAPLELRIELYLRGQALDLSVRIAGPFERLEQGCRQAIHEDVVVFGGRAGMTRAQLDALALPPLQR